MMKIVFFDIDGTLLNKDNIIPDSTKKAVKQLQENGIYVAIATGRAPFMFKHIREQLDIESFVSFNGQYVVFEGNVIYKNPLNKDQLRQLEKHAHQNGHPMVYLNEETMKSSVSHHPYIQESMDSLDFPHPEEDGTFYEKKEIYQALVFCKHEDESLYVDGYDDFGFVRWHRVSTDVVPTGGTKAEGIKEMIKRLNISMEDVYAFGDGLNDIEMLEASGVGIAMGNALPEVKKVANMVTEHVDEDGIWKGLRKVELI
ncbi:Cof-type HAD-IIB family hydrolase [Cytobacillus sp. FSL K6-0265]|uniref:Cof-type HAD-IIB family hydrolase n=1 Tax=Cytobacillus sp. FSL K6-0265 TaxID=2921448 RepID=UPI0030F8657A